MIDLSAAVIGIGFVGRAHVEALHRLGIRVRGILGSTPERSHDVSCSLGLERGYNSIEELAKDSDIHVVHICTPNYLHFSLAKKLIAAGKHVMCEKPLAMDSRESLSLVQVANDKNVVAAVAYNLRYYPLCQEAHSLVKQGAIGKPRLIHGSFLQDWLFYDSDWNWRLEPKLGGDLRAISDIGTHWLDLTTWISGKRVLEVCADLATVIPIRKKPLGRVETFQQKKDAATENVAITTDDYGSVLLHLEEDVRGVFTVSQVSAGRKAKLWFEINGSEASLGWSSEEPNDLWIGHRNQPNQAMIKDPSLMSPVAREYAAYPGGHAEGYPDTFVQLFKDFYSYIAEGDLNAPRKFPTFQTGHEEMVLCDAIALSGRERRWVNVKGI